ncbi:MAG: DUF1254 domain-containing protein [Rhizobacter sp.]|nr:DUF1254 domain-containing protein [Rhizobacter sp.]
MSGLAESADSVSGQRVPLSAAEQAVIYAYPLYEMCRMRADTSPRRLEGGEPLAPPHKLCNVFVHSRKLLAAGKSRVVTPNNDTLYTNAWLDLADGPLVIDVPDTQGRYYVLGLLDMYTNPFAHLGQRLTGTQAQSFLVTGPGWRGDVPRGFDAPGSHVVSPTRWVWIIGRIVVDGPHDVPAVHAVQNGIRVRTLADWQAGRDSAPKVFDPQCDAREPLSAAHFARIVNAAMEDAPPPEPDPALHEALASVGLGPGRPAPEGEVLERLQQALDSGLQSLRAREAKKRTPTGWTQMPAVTGHFGTDYRFRALVALKYIGMLETAEATYPMAMNDAKGRPLNGAHRYTMRFEPAALNAARAFWSLTMYDSADCMLVDNPIDRYAIGDRTPGLRHDADGGLTLQLSHAMPQAPTARANWLPAPAGDFYVCLRFYLPGDDLLAGRITLPAIERAGEATA